MSLIQTATNDEVVTFVRMLMPTFKNKPVSQNAFSAMEALYKKGQASDCIDQIKAFYKLGDTPVRIGYLNDSCGRDRVWQLVRENIHHTGSKYEFSISYDTWNELANVESIPAFVVRPADLPLYGSPEFKEYKVLLFVYKRMLKLPFHLFVSGIAHEFSHVILDLLRHPLCQNEVAVDICAMVSGFHQIMLEARERTLDEWSLGYLDDEQFKIAYKEVMRQSQVIYL